MRRVDLLCADPCADVDHLDVAIRPLLIGLSALAASSSLVAVVPDDASMTVVADATPDALALTATTIAAAGGLVAPETTPAPPSSTSTSSAPTTSTVADRAGGGSLPAAGAPPASTTTVAPSTSAIGTDAPAAADDGSPTTTIRLTSTTLPPSSSPTTARPSDTVRPTTTTAPPSTTVAPATPPSTTTTAPAGAYHLVWADEFDTLDTRFWTREHSTYGDGNDELQCYLPRNVDVVDGHLRLTARQETAVCPYDTRDFSSGMVRTRGRIDWEQGRFEVRARFPEGQGLWPAIWMSPTDHAYGRWPNSGEIDIVEALGHRTNRIIGSLHWSGPDGHVVDNREFFADDGFTSEWHVYSVTWEDGLFVWEVDGIEYHRVDTWASAVGDGDAPFDQPFHLKINLAVGGRAPGSPDATTPWPANLDVDWVRVYQR